MGKDNNNKKLTNNDPHLALYQFFVTKLDETRVDYHNLNGKYNALEGKCSNLEDKCNNLEDENKKTT